MKSFLFFTFFLLSGNIFSQHIIESTISDVKSRLPVSGVHVYLDGTSIGTTTDHLGRFKLTTPNAINTSLVISHILYEKIVFPDPFQSVLPNVIYLEENVSSFEEVTISARRIGRLKRTEMMTVFLKQLLGTSPGAKMCKILNEEDITLIHDNDKKQLRAYAQKPIVVINNYLKYRILIDIIEFTIDYADNTLLEGSMEFITFNYKVFFSDIGNDSESLRTRRNDVLQKSTRNFFRLLANDQMKVNFQSQETMDKSPFFIYENYRDHFILYNTDSYFDVHTAPHDPSVRLAFVRPEMKDSLSGILSVNIIDARTLKRMRRTLSPDSDMMQSIKEQKYQPEDGKINVTNSFSSGLRYSQTFNTYKFQYSNDYSKITFFADTFSIDIYGNTDLYKNHQIYGKLGFLRLGDLLPLEYEDISLKGYLTASDTPTPENDLILTEHDLIYARFLQQLQSFPQEKIYAHIDKSYYFAGETVWFRVFLANYLTHSPEDTESNYVYGELYNPVDSLIQRIKIRKDSADVFRNHFDLPSDLATGNYRLRFYTRYMEESGEEYFFNRAISVGHAASSLYRMNAAFNYFENGLKLQTVLRFTHVLDDTPFVPQLLCVINPLGKETVIAVNGQGIAEFDLKPEHDLNKNLLYIEYEYNKSLHKQYIAVPPLRNEYDVSFFPEGGALPSGVPVRVAFKALHPGGLSEQVTGKIISSTGDTIAFFSSNPLGMGSFIFTPRKGEQYVALCHNRFGVEKRFNLPAVSDHSINLKAEWNNGRLTVMVIHSAGMSLPDSLRLLIHCRGIPFYNDLLAADKSIVIRKEQLPSGVLQLLLADKNLNPVSERLMFHLNEQDVAQVAISVDKENYRKREQVNAQIFLTDNDSIPLQGSFSVSVTEDKAVTPETTVHIVSSLLLTSELKGYVESPAWYFTGENIGEIDHLLLTQGWSRYDISAVLKGNIRHSGRLPEIVPEITGRVKSGLFLQNQGEGYHVVMSASGRQNNYDATSAGVKDGRFRLSYNDLPNGVSYSMQLVFPRGAFRAKIHVDSIVFPMSRIRQPYQLDMDRTVFDSYAKNLGQRDVADNETLVMNFDEVTITAQRKGISPFSPGRPQDRIIRIDQLTEKKMNASNLAGYLRSEADVTLKRSAEGTFVGYSHGSQWLIRYVFLVDGYLLQGNDGTTDNILSISLNKIEEIEIVRSPAPPIILNNQGNIVINDPYKMDIRHINADYNNPDSRENLTGSSLPNPPPGHLGTILITTKARDGGFSSAEKGKHLKINPLGYQVSKEFYSPAYETAEQQNEETPDLRTTIYWNPDIRTNKDGEAEMMFYTADADTSYTVTIEGITDEGVLIRKTEKIKRAATHSPPKSF